MKTDLEINQQKLVNDYLEMVPAVLWTTLKGANRYSALDYEVLLQEGNLALCIAAEKFSCNHDTSFKTYAWCCIKNAILSTLKKINQSSCTLPLEDLHLEQASTEEIWNHIAAVEWKETLRDIQNHYSDETTRKGIDAMIFQSEGLTVKDISKIMDTEDNHIRACCSRARKKLQKHPKILKMKREEI